MVELAQLLRTLLVGGDNGLGILQPGFKSQLCYLAISSSVTWAIDGNCLVQCLAQPRHRN